MGATTALSVDAAWNARADELATWAMARYVVRTDVWGGYVKLSDRDKECVGADGKKFKLGKTCTKPRKAARGSITLTPAVLVKHFRATGAEHVVGIHTTAPENVSKFGVVEIDAHGEEGNDAEATRRAALGWYDKAVGLGFTPLLWDSDGKGGFHLDLLFANPVPTPNLFWHLREFVRDYAAHGLPAPPETFPKQPRVNPDPKGKGHFGNWVRLIGRHHTRHVWATVWNGSEWVSGEAAVAHVLSITGDPPTLISADMEIRSRVREYRKTLPNLDDGQGRDDVAYNFLAFLVRDLALSNEDALRYAGEWDADNRPPKGRERLQEILANVHEYGQRAYGSGRDGEASTLHQANGSTATGAAADLIDVLKRRQSKSDAAGTPTAVAPPEQTDTGNANEFARDHTEAVRWTKSHDWLVWDGKRWRVDDTLAVIEMGKATAGRLVTEAVTEFKRASAALAEVVAVDDKHPEAEAKKRLQRAKQLLANAKYCRQKKGLDAMLALARSIPGIACMFDRFDTQPHLLTVENGTLDLQTGKLHPHRREDRITRLAPVLYEPDAEAPTFGQFLGSTFGGDLELIAWLQRYLGWCLTGETVDHILAVFWGSGSNGKGTLVELLLELLGDYGFKARAELLLARKNDPHPEERAVLCGRRFVACSETDQGRRLNEALVKELTGGDTMNGRFMRQNSFNFRPTWKLALATNHRPEVRGSDHGIWRRIKLVPFTRRFWKPGDPPGPDELRADSNLPAKLRAEYPGILAWMVRGCMEWYANGLGTCKAVETATCEYKQAEDQVAQFVAEQCETASDAEQRATVLFAAYREWADRRKEWVMSQTKFGARLSEMGFGKRMSNGTIYRGVRLAPSAFTATAS